MLQEPIATLSGQQPLALSAAVKEAVDFAAERGWPSEPLSQLLVPSGLHQCLAEVSVRIAPLGNLSPSQLIACQAKCCEAGPPEHVRGSLKPLYIYLKGVQMLLPIEKAYRARYR